MGILALEIKIDALNRECDKMEKNVQSFADKQDFQSAAAMQTRLQKKRTEMEDAQDELMVLKSKVDQISRSPYLPPVDEQDPKALEDEISALEAQLKDAVAKSDFMKADELNKQVIEKKKELEKLMHIDIWVDPDLRDIIIPLALGAD